MRRVRVVAAVLLGASIGTTANLAVAADNQITETNEAMSSVCPQWTIAEISGLLALQTLSNIAGGVYDALPSHTPPDPFGVAAVAKAASGALKGAADLLTFAAEEAMRTSEECFEERNEAKTDQQLIGQIVAALMSANPPPPFLEIPTAKGGLLDADPIGVKQVVHDYYDLFKDAGQNVTAAKPYLDKGDAFLAQGKYKDAYKQYRQAYVYIVK